MSRDGTRIARSVSAVSLAVAAGIVGFACAGGTPDSAAELALVTDDLTSSGPSLVSFASNGKLAYTPFATEPTPLGSTAASHVVPDFSRAGYRGGGVALPTVTANQVTLGPSSTLAQIQAAITGFPASGGVLFLTKGLYTIPPPGIVVTKSKVVIRGEGQGSDQSKNTILKGTTGGQYSLITFEGASEFNTPESCPLAAELVPVGATKVKLASCPTVAFTTNMEVLVVRRPNDKWPKLLEADRYPEPWLASSYVMPYPRKVTAVTFNGSVRTLTLDGSIVDAIDPAYASGEVAKIASHGFIEECGVEDLRLDSAYDSALHDVEHPDQPSDENHAWTGVDFQKTRNSWVKNVTARHLGFGAVRIHADAHFITVQDTAFIDPVSQVTGGRRYPFDVQYAAGNLFQRTYARNSRHNFVTGAQARGPNVWLDSLAELAYEDDGPHCGWSTGSLYDNIATDVLQAMNRATEAGDHGWGGAQNMLWNCLANRLVVDSPPGGVNWSIGNMGRKDQSEYAIPRGYIEPDGWWESQHVTESPRSLYLQQLKDRLGQAAVDAVSVPAQREGRIWKALRAWAGEGRLSDYLADPECDRGLQKDSSNLGCCSPLCQINGVNKCGVSGCGNVCPAGNCGMPADTSAYCCTGTIRSSAPSCVDHAPPCAMPDPSCSTGIVAGKNCCETSCTGSCCTTAIAAKYRSCAEYPPPCVMADPGCVNGVSSRNVCCDESCGWCGGTGCASRIPNDSNAKCCLGGVRDSGKLCVDNPAPCVLADPQCKYGIKNGNTCCDAACGACATSGCGDLPGGGPNCCAGYITQEGRSCADYPAPCIIP